MSESLHSYNETKQELFYVFTYYCSFADRQNYCLMKVQNFKRMLTDAQIIANANVHSIDLLYTKYKKKGNSAIDFEGFIQGLPYIAKISHGEDDDGLRKIIKENFHALYEFIIENTDFGNCVQLISRAIFSENCFKLLCEFSPTLHLIYCQYFKPNAIIIFEERDEIFKQLFTFTKDFDLTPQMLTKAEVYIILCSILEE